MSTETASIDFIVFRAGPEGVPRMGGPAACPRPCSECSENPGGHHFSDAMVDTAEDEHDHEAAQAGIEAWFVCKHCDAWLEWTGDSDELRLYRWSPETRALERSDVRNQWEPVDVAVSLEEAHAIAIEDADEGADEDLDDDLEDEDDDLEEDEEDEA